ncbi:hypothetical protein [Anaeromyxobacter oryzisoli]|uniref:hypothetical protein n=1 Tax=Anaeromyxobacter oryzisoli TaxID=2925408 RepID=UPI001F58587A|nr:hypothetical protein [Anaeromyxobacter sp. SG63]
MSALQRHLERTHMVLVPVLLAAAAAASGQAPEAWPPPPENLLSGPARCVLRYLEAVRLAERHAGDVADGRPAPPRARAYEVARRLTAPRALDEIARRAARGEGHPLAPWRLAARRVLDSFELLAVRRAPRGAAVVTVRERTSVPGDGAAPVSAVAEYLVARVGGDWRVVDRRVGASFDDADVAAGYAEWFDDPSALHVRPAVEARAAPPPAPGPRRPAAPRQGG